jgi:Flp pilus assembly protein CpaB
MKTRGGKFLLVLGAGLAALAFVVVYVVMSRGLIGGAASGPSATVPEVPQTVFVAVANANVPAYTILDSTNVATAEVEASTVASNTTTSPEMLYGKMTLMPLTAGQAVRVDQLTETGFSNILAKGERAYTLAVPERSTFGNALTENDRVDLLWTANLEYQRQSPNQNGELTMEKAYFTSTKTLLQNIHVLRVMQLRLPAPAGNQRNTGDTTAEPAVATTTNTHSATSADMYTQDAPYQTVLVIGVTDQQAEVVKFAHENGVIDLTLRSSAVQKDEAGNIVKDEAGQDIRGDSEIEKTTGISINTLVEQYGMPVPKTP